MSAEDLFLACESGNLSLVQKLLKEGADAAFQDDGGVSPLMVAAKGGQGEIVSELLMAGAPWNALDKNGMCAGEHALQNEHADVANQILDAGVRAELILGTVERRLGRPADLAAESMSNEEYLQQNLQFSSGGDKIIDESGEAVMMDWEAPLMEAHAQAITSPDAHVLNVGFGLGLVDAAIQRRNPKSHTIIEAHPDVYKKMVALGWGEKPGVRIVHGRWQDVISDLGPFDGIFFDTYGEYYPDLRKFHQELPSLLGPGGIYSFFNGLAPDNPFFHAVYCQIVELEMRALGFETTFVPLPIDASKKEIWKGVKNRYWWNDTYFLPVCQSLEIEEGG
ncbi:hypothetical protein BSKO_04622 [Bryopsis sp. KO-2023]|nr:hypothetical protein BSKO_04622 [Bryopsis sp. KO-2023]